MSERLERLCHIDITPPNIDCILDLGDFEDELREVDEVLGMWRKYASTKQEARRRRLAGRIVHAEASERMMERIYNQLPKWAKW